MKNFWLVKQEPESYSWSDFTADKGTSWTGVRNYTARNNLREMRKDDEVFYYHTGDEKAVVGIAKVARTAYADPTATEGDWSAVDLKPVRRLPHSVPLSAIKSDPRLKEMKLVRQSRLSVMPVTIEEFRTILEMAE
jgi:predicted RNA-binding protein with PUA-like domain